jgi:ABC-type lipoprotein release transport system permease subunit
MIKVLNTNTQSSRVQSSGEALTISSTIARNLGVKQGSKVKLDITRPNGSRLVLKGCLTSGLEFYLPSNIRSLLKGEDLEIQVEPLK